MKGWHHLAIVLTAVLAGAAGVWVSIHTDQSRGLAHMPVGGRPGAKSASTAPALGDVTPARIGQAIGPLSLTDLHGNPQTLPRGRPLLVNLWASWCAPCLHEMPVLDAYAATQPADGVAVVGIAEDEPTFVGDFLRKSPIRYPILLDDAHWRASTRLGNGLGVLPYSALIDADGRLLATHAGPFDSVDDLRRWVSALR